MPKKMAALCKQYWSCLLNQINMLHTERNDFSDVLASLAAIVVTNGRTHWNWIIFNISHFWQLLYSIRWKLFFKHLLKKILTILSLLWVKIDIQEKAATGQPSQLGQSGYWVRRGLVAREINHMPSDTHVTRIVQPTIWRLALLPPASNYWSGHSRSLSPPTHTHRK